jgi:GntR family transcriptional regulator / MocR family aminotransferase
VTEIEWSTAGSEPVTGELDLALPAVPARGKRRAIEAALRQAIRQGRLAPGSPLPSTRVLARDLGVARGTVAEVYDVLVAEGWLTARQGSATRVSTVVAPSVRRRKSGERTSGSASAVYHARVIHDFRPGSADVAAFPRRAWSEAGRHAIEGMRDEDLRYGDPRGHPELRRVLAEYLGRARGVDADEDLVVVTSGYTQTLGLVVGALRGGAASRRRPVVAIESPSAATYVEVVRSAGAAVAAVEVDEDGADPATVDPCARLVVLTPAHQYPTGATLSAARRVELATWVREGDRLLLEDDYDGEFRYDRSPIAALQSNAADRVVYAGTTSKTLAPALRLGWVVVPMQLIDRFLSEKECADRHTSTIEQLTLARLLRTGGFDRHIRRQRAEYRKRRDLVVSMFSRHVPSGAVQGIAAGLSLMVDLGGAVEVEERLVEGAAARGIGLYGLRRYWAAPGSNRAGVVVGYATPPTHGFPSALRSLESLVVEVLG